MTAANLQGLPSTGLNARIALAANRGQISTLDRTAFENAVAAIKGDFLSNRSDGRGRLDAFEFRARMKDLIGQQVAGGTLSQQQGAQLLGFYSGSPPVSELDAPSEATVDLAPEQNGVTQAETSIPDQPEAPAKAEDDYSAMSQFLELLRSRMTITPNGYGSAATSFPTRRSPLVIDTLA